MVLLLSKKKTVSNNLLQTELTFVILYFTDMSVQTKNKDILCKLYNKNGIIICEDGTSSVSHNPD